MIGVDHLVYDHDARHLDRFGPLLVLTVITVVAMSLVELGSDSHALWPVAASTAVVVIISLTLLLALNASGFSRRVRRGALVVVSIGILYAILRLVVELAGGAEVAALEPNSPSPMWVAIAAISPVAVIRRLIAHRRVTAGTMYGAVAAYLLIAVAFAYTFLYLDSIDSPYFAGAPDEPSTSFMYFSLVSITTVGYGDLAPAQPLGRLLANGEAVIGQVYLVTFVAMLVGLIIQQRGDGETT